MTSEGANVVSFEKDNLYFLIDVMVVHAVLLAYQLFAVDSQKFLRWEVCGREIDCFSFEIEKIRFKGFRSVFFFQYRTKNETVILVKCYQIFVEGCVISRAKT